MESDFTTRHHLDSVTPHSDPSVSDLLLRYRHPPVETKSTKFSMPEARPSGSDLQLGSILGQLQGAVQSLLSRDKDQTNLGGSGLQLSINSDILRWLIVLLFILVFAIVLLKYMNYRRAIVRNPLKKRLRKLEQELLELRRNPGQLKDE